MFQLAVTIGILVAQVCFFWAWLGGWWLGGASPLAVACCPPNALPHPSHTLLQNPPIAFLKLINYGVQVSEEEPGDKRKRA